MIASDNDIIGSNSGSPVVGRGGRPDGLICDGTIHSPGGAYGFDGRLNRAVSVDSAAIPEAPAKIYGAGYLAAGMGAK